MRFSKSFNQLTHSIFVASILFFIAPLHADYSPWFTGPILAPSGRTIPNGHTNFEFYTFLIESDGRYNDQSHFVSRPLSQTTQFSGIFGHGLTDMLDMQFIAPYTINKFRKESHQDVGDMSILLGFQAMTQPEGSWQPNLRITLKETIPTGKFDKLSTTLLTTDDHGKGSYLTTLNFNFQTMFHPFTEHYLRTRLALSITKPSTVNVEGMNVFGGGSNTFGSVNPGMSESIDLSGEFTVNQNWVLVMEGYYSLGARLHFRGNPGLSDRGIPLAIQSGPNALLSFAPAVEYNFNANYGLIAGAWFSVQGKNISAFYAPVIALNGYW
jgi:hypothetical protein